ncbi:protein FAM200C-like [Palaemon carinicauda]|uniref:protein FAM200C-like n=1 Tax=Palaemon carinicauda TaxID=392227 RepID=UPI0035B6539A
MQPGEFSLQFDESCDIASCAVLLGFVRYVHQDRIKEEFLLCENLLTTTKGEDVFNIINSFFTKNGLDWNSVQQVSVDGAPAMMGGHRGLRGLIQAVNPEISVDHCIIHRYSLGSKSLPGNLKLVFEDVLKIVNFIKSRDVNSRIFKELCKEMGEEYQVLLYHTDVRWLSRGKVVHRVIELRKAIQEFLEQKGSPFATKFTDKEWLARLCYLADIFAELNSGNLQLQGRNTTVIDARHTVAAFLAKLRLWIRRLEKGVIAQFPTLDQFIEENSHDTGSLLQTINKEMSDHLKGLETSMHHYFPESDQETASLQWIIHPFSVPDEAIHDDDFPAKEEWITIRANEAMKIEFQNQNADSFWISRLADSPTLSKRALKLLVSFSTTYLCEKGFSTVLGMKTKKRTRLNVANDARLALSTTKPRIPQVLKSRRNTVGVGPSAKSRVLPDYDQYGDDKESSPISGASSDTSMVIIRGVGFFERANKGYPLLIGGCQSSYPMWPNTRGGFSGDQSSIREGLLLFRGPYTGQWGYLAPPTGDSNALHHPLPANMDNVTIRVSGNVARDLKMKYTAPLTTAAAAATLTKVKNQNLPDR